MDEERRGKIEELLSLLEEEEVAQAVLRAMRRAAKNPAPPSPMGQASSVQRGLAERSPAEEQARRTAVEKALKQEQNRRRILEDDLRQARNGLEQARQGLRRMEADRDRAEQARRDAEAVLAQRARELAQARQALQQAEADREQAERARQDMEAALARTKQELERLSPFRETVEAFERYRALAAGLPEYLAQSLPRDNAVHFLTVGCQRDTIERLWDRFREQAEQLTAEQLEVVVSLLAFFLERYNSLYDRPVYRLMLEEEGRPFDDQRHSRSLTCSKYQGLVERVVFPGIWNLGQDKALRKSVVYFQGSY